MGKNTVGVGHEIEIVGVHSGEIWNDPQFLDVQENEGHEQNVHPLDRNKQLSEGGRLFPAANSKGSAIVSDEHLRISNRSVCYCQSGISGPLWGTQSMGRRKEYDPNDLLEQARRLFLEQGFEATSIADLEERLGINRKSLYAEFGGKQDLFEAALELHHAVNVSRRFEPLETPDAGLAEIRAEIEALGAGARGSMAGRGCLLCNTASERSAIDPASRKHVRAYLKRIRAAFQNALTNARAAGDLDPSVDIEAEARFFASHGIGQLTIIRSNAAPDIVEAAAEVALAHLQSLGSGG